MIAEQLGLHRRPKVLEFRVVDVLNEASYLEAAKLLREKNDLPLVLFVLMLPYVLKTVVGVHHVNVVGLLR